MWGTIAQDLALAIPLLAAGLLGAVLGWDRQTRGKAAGLRTHILVSIA